MRAARLDRPGAPIRIEDIADPSPGGGGVVVRVLATHIPNYTGDVLAGRAGSGLPDRPFTPGPGAIGVVEAVGPDVIGIEPGQRVSCSSLLPPRPYTHLGDAILMG